MKDREAHQSTNGYGEISVCSVMAKKINFSARGQSAIVAMRVARQRCRVAVNLCGHYDIINSARQNENVANSALSLCRLAAQTALTDALIYRLQLSACSSPFGRLNPKSLFQCCPLSNVSKSKEHLILFSFADWRQLTTHVCRHVPGVILRGTRGNAVPIVKVFKNAQERSAALKDKETFIAQSSTLAFGSLLVIDNSV